MKKLFTVTNSEGSVASALKTGLSLVAGAAMAGGLWFATLPMVHGASSMTPAEMIQSNLPANTTIATATDAQLLDAVCKAVRKHPREAGLMVRTAAGARMNMRSEIVCMALRCGREAKGADCSWVLDVVRDWIKTDPSLTNQLIESISECAPDCREALQGINGANLGEGNFANPPTNINPPPGSSGGGAGGNVCLVCHNGQEIQIACSDLDSYLKRHPGDTPGPCQPTPVTNQ